MGSKASRGRVSLPRLLSELGALVSFKCDCAMLLLSSEEHTLCETALWSVTQRFSSNMTPDMIQS